MRTKERLVGIVTWSVLFAAVRMWSAESPETSTDVTWPGYRGPRYDGSTEERIDFNQATLEPLWKTTLASGLSG